MRVLHESGAHHTRFLQHPTWPQNWLFHQYLTQTAWATANHLPDNKDMKTSYQDFRAQHPCPVRATEPYTRVGSKQEPVPPVTGKVPLLTLHLARSEAKRTQTTAIRHGAKQRIPKHHMTPQDLTAVPHDSQLMPRTCWAGDPTAPTTPWPLSHLKAPHHAHPTTHLPPQAYVLVAP